MYDGDSIDSPRRLSFPESYSDKGEDLRAVRSTGGKMLVRWLVG